MSNESLSKQLQQHTLGKILEKYTLHEEKSEDGPYRVLTNHLPKMEGAIGTIRKYVGKPFFQIVTFSIMEPKIGFEANMFVAFMPSDSVIPHFSLNSAYKNSEYAITLDLIPRVDMGSNKRYMDESYAPLTNQSHVALALEGLSSLNLDPRQCAAYSPWVVQKKCDKDNFVKLTETVDHYFDHWLSLVENGISTEATEGIDKAHLIARDKRNKSIIYNLSINKLWVKLDGLIGNEDGRELRRLLRATSA